MTIGTRKILTTMAGYKCGLDEQGAIVVNKRDGTSFYLDSDMASVNLTAGTTTAIATANTTALQAALTRGGEVRVTSQGTYYVNSVMTIPSNTSVYIGAGVTLKVADSAVPAVFTNSSARHAGVAVSAANANYTTAPDGVNYCVAITSMTAANAALFPVDSWVSVVVLGHGALGVKGTAWAGRGYRGVCRVVEQTINGASSSIKYLIEFLYPGSGPSSNNLTLYPANENIKVWGPGKIDGNGGSCDQTYVSGDPRGVVVWWRHAVNVSVDGPAFRRGPTWTIGSNYVRDYYVKVWCELRNASSFNSIDLVHLSGYHNNALVYNTSGGAGDNFVGMTIDCTEGTVYDFPYQSPGDMYNIKVRNVWGDCVSEDGGFGVVAVYGPEAYRYQNIEIDGVAGSGSSAVLLSNYAATNQNKLIIDDIRISNTRVATGGAQVYIEAGVYAINSMIVDRPIAVREDAGVFTIADGATGTIRSLTLSNLMFSPYDGATYTRTAPMVKFGGIDIAATNVSGMEDIAQAANVKAIQRTGNGTLTKLSFTDVSATGSGSGATFADTGGGSAPSPTYLRCTYNGAALP